MAPHVLLVDDNEIDTLVARRVLELSGSAGKVTTFNSSVLALSWLKSLHGNDAAIPDFIFLDWSMPMMDGVAFLDELQKLEAGWNNHPQVYMITNSTSLVRERPDLIASHKVKAILNKPLPVAEVQNLLSGYESVVNG